MTLEEIHIYGEKIFGKEFKFRPNQAEVILDIINTYQNKESNMYILDAPTGSGKSIIAMVITTIMATLNSNSYILASDISLFDQYVSDIRKSFPSIKYVKGSGNYTCSVNNLEFPLGVCRLRNMSISEAIRTLPCANDCGYIQAREHAIAAATTLTTYHYWLLQMNQVRAQQNDGAPFKVRDITICDEAHKLQELIQSNYSPVINYNLLSKCNLFFNFLVSSLFLEKADLDLASNIEKYVLALLSQESDDTDEIFQLIKKLHKYLSKLTVYDAALKQHIKSINSKKIIPDRYLKASKISDQLLTITNQLEDYITIINESSHNNIIYNRLAEDSVKLNSLDDRFLMKKYFHSNVEFCLMMSATIGDIDQFVNINGIDSYKYSAIDDTFDYKKSPIICNKKYKLSYNEKTKSMPLLITDIDKILNSYSDVKGIIHSGSYELSNYIYNNLSQINKLRIFIYKDSDNKSKTLDAFMKSDNGILMGPSILEGLDLKDDLSRFTIIAKVPYPSLADKYVKKKLDHDDTWYKWKTVNAILQGIGRSKRTHDDYAVTFILDGCFIDILRYNTFRKEFINRIKFI